MTSPPVALLLATLGVVPSHSRPTSPMTIPSPRRSSRPSSTGRTSGSVRSTEDAEAFGQRFFPWYNLAHRRRLGLMTPHDMHYGLAEAKWQQRAEVPARRLPAHPERFPRGVPVRRCRRPPGSTSPRRCRHCPAAGAGS
jgi:putative transposase